MAKAALDLICRKLASTEYSHTAAWAWLRANQLRNVGIDVDVLDQRGEARLDDWSQYDTIYIYHGMDVDYTPACKVLNVFDGLAPHSAKFFERLAWPQHDHIKYVSLDWPMIDYGWRCGIKKGTPSDYWKGVDWAKVSDRCKGITDWILDPGLTYGNGKVRHLVIGDSHSFSAYKPTSLVLRKDGRTLRGIIKKGIVNEITEYGFDMKNIDSMTCYWGSIDIRHHICREADPIAFTKELLRDYEQALVALDRPIELVTPLPIEDESRVLPKAGWYKGTPFTGTRAERQAVLNVFIDGLREMAAKHAGWSIFEWPEEWYKMDGVAFMNTYMERPRSVHLGRKFYRWDLKENVPNPLLAAKTAATLLSF